MEEQGSPVRVTNADEIDELEGGTRLRRRNVTVDWEVVEVEKRRTLKRARGNAKRGLTLALKQISDALLAEGSFDAVASESKLVQVFEKFTQACDSYKGSLTDKDDLDECMAYFHEAEVRFICMKDRLALHLETRERFHNNESTYNRSLLDSVSDSKSQTTSFSRSSNSSRGEIVKAKLRSATKKAALLAEESMLQRRRSLEKLELELRQQKEELHLKTEIAKIEAEEKACETFEISMQARSGEYSDPVASRAHASQLSGEFSDPVVSRARKNRAPFSVQSQAGSSSCSPDAGVEYLEVMKNLAVATLLPKSEMISFDGNPLKYFTFLRSFETNVEKDTSDFSRQLQLLVQFCTGKATKVVENCILLEPEEGYKKAKKLLAERFGDRFKVTNSWITKVSHGPKLKSGDREGLLDFVDDLQNCEITLKATGRLTQINNEDRLVKILERCPGYVKSRWQTRVQEIRKEDRDPNIET